VAGIAARPESSWSPAERELVQKAQAQGEARTTALRGEVPPDADPATVRTVVQQRLADMDQQHEANLTAAQQASERAQTALGDPLPPEVRGGQIRDQVEAAKAVTKANERDLWEAIDPDGTLRIDQRPIAGDARGVGREIPKSAKPPEGEEAAIFGIASMGGSAVPFTEFTALRSRLLTAIREERLTNGETPALRRMQQLRSSIDATINDAAANNFGEGAAERY